MTIDVYPSTLPGEPIERHEWSGTLGAWLSKHCQSYKDGAAQPVSVSVGGVVVDPAQWYGLACDCVTVEIRPNPRDPVTLLYVAGGLLAGAVIMKLFAPKIPEGLGQGQRGTQLALADAAANRPKLNGVIPEIAGRHKVYPDYLVQPRRFFVDPHTEAVDMFLCIGYGEFDIDPDEVYIGETPFSTFGDEVEFTVYGPGASVTGSPQSANYYHAPEVGGNGSGAGLRLQDDEESTAVPSTITGSAVAELNYAASPKTFYISDYAVTLNTNLADHDALCEAIILQADPDLTRVDVTHTGGIVKLTQNRQPFGGDIVLFGPAWDLTSYYSVFGSSPVYFEGNNGAGVWVGPFRATPANEGTESLAFNLFAPNGLGVIDGDDILTRSVVVEIQWRYDGGSWNTYYQVFSGSTRDQIGLTFGFSISGGIGPRQNVDVRMRRLGNESTDLNFLDRIEWTALRCALPATTSYAGVTTMAVRIVGSDRISGQSENKINAIVTRKLGGVATRSIAPWVRYVCGSVGYSEDDINTDELDALATVWDARGDYFDHVTNGATTVKEALATALRVGFAELTLDAGKIRPVRDQVRTVYEHMYTPQNMTGPLRRQFTAYDPDDFDGVDVTYTSAVTWEEELVQCRLSGDAGARVEKIKIEGVTDETRAWRIGMRARRAQKYRRKGYSFSTELDALNSRYLSFCALSDDVPGYGQSALLVAVTGAVLTVSEPLQWVDGASHVVALRRPDGILCGPFPAVEIDAYALTITGTIDFTPITTAGSIEKTHILFGTTTNWSYPVLITDISPSGETVDVTAIGYDARVYADDDNSPT